MQNFISERTKTFTQDLTFQHTASIAKEINTRTLSIKMIADALNPQTRVALDTQVEEILQRKQELSVFNALYYIDAKEIQQAADGSEFVVLPDHQFTLQHPEQLHQVTEIDSFLIDSDGKDNIYYIHQITDGNSFEGLLVGIRNRNELQDFIQLKALNSETVSCVVDKNTNIIISPTGAYLPSHRLIDDYLLFKDIEENRLALQQLRENVANLQQDIQEIINIDGLKLLVSYTPLGINDWGILTFVPDELISVNAYMHLERTFYTSIIAILIFGFITIATAYTFKKNKREMEQIAFYDPITQGLNKDGFTLRFKEIVEPNPSYAYSVVLMNMKHFKLINEQFGKEEGDRLLYHINHCIEKCLHPNEFVGRFTADRFFLCLKDRDQNIIESRLRYMVAEITAFNENSETPYNLEFHCGVRLMDESTHELIQLQDHAHVAYEHAVAEKAFAVFYDQKFINKLLKEQELNMLFEDSLERGDFKLYLQPKVRLDTGTVCGAEALVRWFHPEKGVIYPSDFIPLFESNGKICQLDLYMFTEVCKTLQRWEKEGRQLFPISFNLSRQHYFQNPGFLDTFIQVATEYKIPRGLLDFELTESIFFDNDKFKAVKKSLDEMHHQGFLCSLDDFGVGYSSLGLLKEFDIDTIKFDRQFFLDVSTDKSKTIVESLMGMSEKLGIKTVAEGIETHHQLSYLNETTCNIIQGYIYSMPLAVQEFESWLDKLTDGKPDIKQINF
ncbi:MAG: EAL domain-containing protein [Treponema sp.]|nr:EAL domain-containing protein [Treponema sp.]